MNWEWYIRTKYFGERTCAPCIALRFVCACAGRPGESRSPCSPIKKRTTKPTRSTSPSAAAQALHAACALYMQDWETAIEYSSKSYRRTQLHAGQCENRHHVGRLDTVRLHVVLRPKPRSDFPHRSSRNRQDGRPGCSVSELHPRLPLLLPDFAPAQWVLSAYGQNDLRYASYFADKSNGIVIGYGNGMKSPVLVKYYGNRTFVKSNIFHRCMPKPFRLAEQYLIRAEAY